MSDNLDTYRAPEVVRYYEKYATLQKPEEVLLGLLSEELAQMHMLDIGIGAGRTTRFFASRVGSYTGIDYSDQMVTACVRQFGEKPGIRFLQADARKLEAFPENHFDLVLFSFNGIDYILPEERKLALQQIHRVMKQGAFFCFSTHNLLSLLDFPAFELRWNIPAAIRRFFEVKKIKKINRRQFSEAARKDFVVINDGAHDFGLETCYFRPSYQVKQLTQLGFTDIKVYGLDGKTADANQEALLTRDKWLYYLCRKS